VQDEQPTPDEYRRRLDKEAARAAHAAAYAAPQEWRGPEATVNPYGAPHPDAAAPAAPVPPGPYGAPAPYAQATPPPGSWGYGRPPFDPAAAYGAYGMYPPAPSAASPEDLTLPLRGAGMGQAIARFFKNYATFTGRASQSEYLWMVLTHFLVYLVLGVLAIVIGVSTYDGGDGPSGALALPLVLALLYGLGTLVPNIALGWRRLHDTGQPGPMWFLSFIPYAGELIVFIMCCLAPKPEGARYDVPPGARPYGY